jgi:prepilin signal peptidase PulO-like enzyme (type II secretory pathway)
MVHWSAFAPIGLSLLIVTAFGYVGDLVYSWVFRRPSVSRVSSNCDGCGRSLDFLDMYPVAGYIAAWGKCRSTTPTGAHCGELIPVSYVWAELAGLVVGGVLVAGFWLTHA